MIDISIDEINVFNQELLAFRRDLHQEPELGMDCFKTRDKVEAKLIELGYDVKRCGHSGLTTTIGNGKGPVFLLRADMDALPIKEDSGVAFSSKNEGIMHACGHDMHTTMLLGAAMVLKQYEKDINGTIKLMFQPGEEIMQGAKNMIDAGVLQNPSVDAGMMVHVMTGVPFDIGTLVFMADGAGMASSDWFDIKIQGKGGHGSSPYLGRDPLIPATAIIQALQNIQTRELPPNALVSLTVGALSGPTISNVIPDTVTFGGTIRAYDEAQRAFIKERVTQIASHIAQAYRCEAIVTFPVGVPTLISSNQVSKPAKQALTKIVGPSNIVQLTHDDIPNMGSEDFGYISHEIPVTSIMVVASDSRLESDYPLHHPKLFLNEDAISYGVLAYAQTALCMMERG